MAENKRVSLSPGLAGSSTPAKKTRLNSTTTTTQERSQTPSNGLSLLSSPVVERELESPSIRGEQRREGRGGGRKTERGRGGKYEKGRGGADYRPGTRGTDERSWGGGSSNPRDGKMREWGKKEGDNLIESEVDPEDKKERLPKKKVAVLFGYNGTDFKGSQINPEVATVEGELFKAFVKAGAVSEDNADSHQKVALARAARTDTGVHAAVNIVCLKLILSPSEMPAGTKLSTFINSFLPPTIRIWSIIRVQGAFNPRALCDQREYEYSFPTHVLLGPKPGTFMHSWLSKSRESGGKPDLQSVSMDPPAMSVGESLSTSNEIKTEERQTSCSAAATASEEFWSKQPTNASPDEEIKAKRSWRIPGALLEEAKSFVKAFQGSFNYYNYTVGKDFRDRSCQRVMRTLNVSDPFEVDGAEYISVTFLGQSFMLHQIRKMIGLAILAIRSGTPSSLIAETFGPSRIHVPKAPGIGLLLVEPQYNEYNKRVVESNRKFEQLHTEGRMDDQSYGDQIRETLNWADSKEEINNFKREMIYNRMWSEEEKESMFDYWVTYLDTYNGPDFEYLNSKGIIPAPAVFKRGENPGRFRGSLPKSGNLSDEEVLGADEGEG